MSPDDDRKSRRAIVRVGKASEWVKRASERVGRASERVGRASEMVGNASWNGWAIGVNGTT